MLYTAPLYISPPYRRPSASGHPGAGGELGARERLRDADGEVGVLECVGADAGQRRHRVLPDGVVRRDDRIGGVLVRTSLCQAATWMASLGARPPSRREWLGRVTRLLWASDRRSTTVGDLTYLPPDAAVRMSVTPPQRHGLERWWPDDAPTDDLVVPKK